VACMHAVTLDPVREVAMVFPVTRPTETAPRTYRDRELRVLAATVVTDAMKVAAMGPSLERRLRRATGLLGRLEADSRRNPQDEGKRKSVWWQRKWCEVLRTNIRRSRMELRWLKGKRALGCEPTLHIWAEILGRDPAEFHRWAEGIGSARRAGEVLELMRAQRPRSVPR